MLSLVSLVGAGAAGCVARWSASTTESAWAALWGRGALGGTAGRPVEHVVVLVCAATLTVVLTWLLVGLLVCSVDVVRARRTGGGTAFVTRAGPFRPRLARALVSAVAAAVASGSPAAAASNPDPATGGPLTDGVDHRTPHLPQRLEGLAVPDRPYGGVRTHRVAAGESLWSITADLLAARTGSHESRPGTRPGTRPATRAATNRTISRAWPQLHRLNRDRLGRDPHLIHPGTKLRLPAWATVPIRGAIR